MKIQALVRTGAALLVASGLAWPSQAHAEARVLKIDKDHSTVTFRVRHLFTRVHGRFGDFDGTLTFDEAYPAGSKVEAVIKAASVDTDVEARDKDLRSNRFFDVDRFPAIEFRTTRVEGSGSEARVIGDLTMNGVTMQVTLETEFLGKGKDPWGNERYGFHAETKVSRKDFGMTWNEVVEAGGVLVGDEVEITLDIEAVPAP